MSWIFVLGDGKGLAWFGVTELCLTEEFATFLKSSVWL